MSKCQTCISFSQKISANHPKKLTALITKIKAAVENGTLIEIEGSHGDYADPFSKVEASGDWQDIINNEFRCSVCAKHYVLFADTYHGGNRNGWSEANT